MSELLTRAQRSASLWRNNPVLVHVLGLSPLLALSTSLVVTLALVLCASLVLILATLTCALMPVPVPKLWRYVWYVFVLAVLITIVNLVLQSVYPALHDALGLYLPLLACNFALLLHLDSHEPETALPTRLRRTLILLASYALVALLFATLRELLGTGSLLTDLQLLLPGTTGETATGNHLFDFALRQPGGLILLGLLVAAARALSARWPGKPVDKTAIEPARRARVTEKLQAGN